MREQVNLNYLFSGTLSFQEIIDELRAKELFCLIFDDDYRFTKEFFCKLIDDHLATNDELKVFLESVDFCSDPGRFEGEYGCSIGTLFVMNDWMIEYCIEKNLFTPKKLFELLKEHKNDIFIDERISDRIFNKFLEHGLSEVQILSEIVDSINTAKELTHFCGASGQHSYYLSPQSSNVLLKKFLKSLLLDSEYINLEQIDKLNILSKHLNSLNAYNESYFDSYSGNPVERAFSISSVFDLIAFYLSTFLEYDSDNYDVPCERSWYVMKSEEQMTDDIKKLLDFNEIIKYVYKCVLNEEQKLELIEVLRDNEIAQNRLSQIIETNLQDQYDFESLISLLTKDDKKNLKTKFNF